MRSLNAIGLFCLVDIAFSIAVSTDCYLQDLGGSSWFARNARGTVQVTATVPGQIHLDLYRAGLIVDPYADNATVIEEWVRDDSWTFFRNFSLDPGLVGCKQIFLIADGLDTLGTLIIDGTPPVPWLPDAPTAVNQIPSDRLNFTSTICAANSTLIASCADACVEEPSCVGFTTSNPPPSSCCWLYSWVPSLQTSPDGDWWARPPVPHPPNETSLVVEDMFLRYIMDATESFSRGSLHNVTVAFTSVSGRQWSSVRKEADSWGYDWAPITQTQGIWQPIYLMGVNGVAVTHIVPQITAEPPNPQSPLVDGDNTFRVNLTVVLLLPSATTVVLSAVGSWGGPGSSATMKIALPAGESSVSFNLSACNVSLWWPHTHGEPSLYNLTVTARAVDVPSSAIATRRVGFRSVALVANYTSSPPEQFYRVNGVELFVMGADWVPADAFQGRFDDSRLRDVLSSVVSANMNILRIWGGGRYNPDSFYDMTDELGIMVHSEGQFTDATYPFDAHVLELISSEALHQARRLASHPSIIVWVGNNEM